MVLFRVKVFISVLKLLNLVGSGIGFSVHDFRSLRLVSGVIESGIDGLLMLELEYGALHDLTNLSLGISKLLVEALISLHQSA